MNDRILRPWSDSSPQVFAEIGELVVFLWEGDLPVICVGRLVKVHNAVVFATTDLNDYKLRILGLDPLEPDFWTYYPKGENKDGI